VPRRTLNSMTWSFHQSNRTNSQLFVYLIPQIIICAWTVDIATAGPRHHRNSLQFGTFRLLKEQQPMIFLTLNNSESNGRLLYGCGKCGKVQPFPFFGSNFLIVSNRRSSKPCLEIHKRLLISI
jgi:hypothetical protein